MDFLSSINTFNGKSDFFPLYSVGGKLVSFCNNRTEKSRTGLYIEHTPESTDMEDGDVYYIKEPDKLKKAFSIIPLDRIPLTFTNNQIKSTSNDFRFTFRLYDPLLASRNNSFWKPEQFGAIKDNLKDGFEIDTKDMKRIKDACSVVEDDRVFIENNEEDGMIIRIGEVEKDSLELKFPYSEGFSRESIFVKDIFRFLGKNPVIFSETENEKVICIKEDMDTTTKHYIITKIKE